MSGGPPGDLSDRRQRAIATPDAVRCCDDPWIPPCHSQFSIAVTGWSLGHAALIPLGLGLGALLYLTASFLVAMRGASVSPRFIMEASAFESLAMAGPGVWTKSVATRLVYARANEPLGTRLVNYNWAAQHSAVIAAILTGIAAILIVTSSAPFGPAASTSPTPSPSAVTASPSRTSPTGLCRPGCGGPEMPNMRIGCQSLTRTQAIF